MRNILFYVFDKVFIMFIIIPIMFLILAYCCITDILYRQIKNISVLLVLMCSGSLAGISGDFNIIIPVLVLVIGFLLTLFGVIGAGDIKLLFALCISIPSELIGLFFFVMCCLGAPISIMVLCISRFVFKIQTSTVPFGIAISVGYIITMWRFL